MAEEKARKAIYRVTFDRENKKWLITKDGAARTIASFNTKAEAMDRVKALSENQDLSFVVKKKNGKFQKK